MDNEELKKVIYICRNSENNFLMKIQVVIGETLGMCHIVSVLSVRVCIHLVLGTSQCANEHLVLGTSQCDVFRVRVCIHLVLGTSQCANDHLVLGTSRRKASPVSETPRPAIIGNHENRSIQKGLCNNTPKSPPNHDQNSEKERITKQARRYL